MASKIENILDKIGNTIQDMTKGGYQPTIPTPNSNGKNNGQTCLEKVGMEMRKNALMKNEWQKDLQYTKTLVDAEYLVQSEFKIS